MMAGKTSTAKTPIKFSIGYHGRKIQIGLVTSIPSIGAGLSVGGKIKDKRLTNTKKIPL